MPKTETKATVVLKNAKDLLEYSKGEEAAMEEVTFFYFYKTKANLLQLDC